MKITVSESNQIVQFMKRMRSFRDITWRRFPDDICTFTREFIASLLIACTIGAMCGLVLFVMYYSALVAIFGPAEWLDLIPGVMGWILWASALVVLFVWSRKELIERGYIDPRRKGPSPVGEAVRGLFESESWRLLRDMYEHAKEKTCVRVDIRDGEDR